MVLASSLKLMVLVGLLLLVGCNKQSPDSQQPAQQAEALPLPQRLDKPYVLVQFALGGKDLVIWDEGGGCKLKVGKEQTEFWLKPTAPCFFIRSPASERVQVYQHDKHTQVVAVVGTHVKGERCGQEVQGIILDKQDIRLSTYVMQGSVYCASQGLHNYQYGLFTKQK